MEYDADVIVIGSGALGNNAAYELAKQGKSVIILEAGKSIPRWKITENFRTSPRKNNYNDPYPNAATAPTSFAKDYYREYGLLCLSSRNVEAGWWHNMALGSLCMALSAQ
ncbi:MAG: FAD-dependent oxidoreductase [Zymomonas mobilis]|uniref:FAD-dependent oxidoreductase n=1 Tax=Zymomonas mobilis TaxID=542 RepID=UPI0002FA7F4D|nr:FAD-dependent oxidoreductase [Zymomonas mobilis]